MKKDMPSTYRSISKMLDFPGYISGIRGTLISRCLEGIPKDTGAYNMEKTRYWYRSIDIVCVLFQEKFECEFFIPILKNRATLHKKQELGSRKISKILGQDSAHK